MESERPIDGERRRARESEPEPPRRGPLRPADVLALQRSVGNCAVATMVQRMKARPDLTGADYVEFDEGEPLPNRIKGTLASDPDHTYQADATQGERIYRRTPKVAGPTIVKRDPAELARERKAKELKTAKGTLFDAAQNGGVEGSFEYVANYLFGEVFSADPGLAQSLWNEVWEVSEPPGEDPVALRRAGVNRTSLLERMIKAGLDASWKRLPVQELVKVSVDGKLPGASMPVVVENTFDYFSALYNWTPWPESSGIGFHTTDGAPGDVAKPKDKGGWGGITRPITVGFFKDRYALAQSWNPLGNWMEKNGPTFRKGIKDNELLSTVSVATAIHGSVRFPLADTPGRKGTHKAPNKNKQDTFRMEVYLYAVRIGSGYATFAKQGANAFGEIATSDIPIDDIIGWSKITRWHPYAKDTGNPLTIGFDYSMTPLERNPQFPVGGINERIFAAALAEINREIGLTSKPYEG
jgi:hypothetical protein